MRNKDVWTSVRIVWFIVSIICCVLVLSPFILRQETIYNIAAFLQVKHEQPCILCGMTRAFLSLSKGDIQQALRYNNYSVFVVLIIAANILSNLIYLFYKIKPKE